MNNIFCFRNLLFLLWVLTFLLGGCVSPQRLESDKNWIDVAVNQEEARWLQEQVDNGHRPGLLDTMQVAREFVYYHLEMRGEVTETEVIRKTREGEYFCITYEEGQIVELFLVQPVRQEPTGIWIVTRYRLAR